MACCDEDGMPSYPWPVPESHIRLVEAQAKGRRAAELEHDAEVQRRQTQVPLRLRSDAAQRIQRAIESYSTSPPPWVLARDLARLMELWTLPRAETGDSP